jgi:uncharacterized protein
VAHVSLITLGVADLARAARFYASLGWRRSPASVDGVVTFLAGGCVTLGLYAREDLAEDAGIDVLATPPAAVALATNLASPAEVDAMLASAAAAGGTVTRPAEGTDWGGYSGYFRDRDGHLWEVAHNPGFPLRRDGSIVLPVGDR